MDRGNRQGRKCQKSIQTVTIGHNLKNFTPVYNFFQSIHAIKLTIHAIAVNIIFPCSDITNEQKEVEYDKHCDM